MIWCLNPDCYNPVNPDDRQHCQTCEKPLIPRLRDRYRIVRPLGGGAFGKTYLAEDTDKFNESCVVKQLLPKQSLSPKVRELFEREARVLQQVGMHPQIPSLSAYFEEGGYLFLVQEFVPGKSLQKEFEDKKSRYSEAEVQQILVNLLKVLQFVHEKGVIHRDLKPDNIMRHKNGQLYVIDFGLSKELDLSLGTQAGTLGGTPGYMPYEQWVEGKSTLANDLYALGVIAFYLLSGVVPRQAGWDANTQSFNWDWTKNWQQWLPAGVNERFAQVLSKLLEKDYKQRYALANAALGDLGIEIKAYPTPKSTDEPKNLGSGELTVEPTDIRIVTESLKGVPLEMIYIPAGSFEMGQSEAEKAYLTEQFGEEDYEKYFAMECPQHQVHVPAFYMGKTPITQGQYQAVMGKNPSRFVGDEQRPVDRVSWDDAVTFCQSLTELTQNQRIYRLPSEAEWEYACRAGTTTRYSFGDHETLLPDYAWYGKNNGSRTHPVGQKLPNSWGLYDMHGNVWEWCADHWHNSYQDAPVDGSAWLSDKNKRYRMLRGGSWNNDFWSCSSAYRGWYARTYWTNNRGFRVVCSAV